MPGAVGPDAADLLIGSLPPGPHERQDRGELAVGAPGEIAAHPLAHRGIVRGQRGKALRIGGYDDPAPVGGIRGTADVAGALKTVKHLGDGTTGQAEPGGEIAGRRGATGEQAHALNVGQRHAKLIGDRDGQPHRGSTVPGRFRGYLSEQVGAA
jgi:hypothetical protein